MSRSRKFAAFAPLVKFRSGISRLNLGKSLNIRRMTGGEINEVERHLSVPFQYPQASPVDLLTARHVLKFSFEVSEAYGTELPYQRVRLLEQALRLFDMGDVGFPTIRIKQIGGDPILPATIWIGMQGTIPPFGNRYSLTPKRGDVFRKFWRKMSPLLDAALTEKPNPLRLALHRFSTSYQRRHPEDRLIDYVIAFETLLLPEKNELRLRLSNRGGLLLGRNDSEREKTASRLRCSYGVRSEIVHGGRVKPKVKLGGKEIPLTDFVQMAERDLARILKMFLLLSPRMDRKEIIKIADSSLLSTKSFKSLRQKLRRNQSYIFTEK